MRGLRNRNCSSCRRCRSRSKSFSRYRNKRCGSRSKSYSRYGNGPRYNRRPCGCNSICDSITACGSDISCILNSYRLNKGTKEKYIYHYNLRDDDDYGDGYGYYRR